MANNPSRGHNLDDLQAIVVSWDGPWEIKAACEFDSSWGNGLYLLVGRIKRTSKRQMIYVGITERSFAARLNEHIAAKRFENVLEMEVWFGSLDFPKHSNRPHLERAEKIIIREWDTTHNIKGKVTIPHPTCLVMRWYFPFDFRGWRPRLRRPIFMRKRADVLWTEKDEHGEELKWHGALKQRKQHP